MRSKRVSVPQPNEGEHVSPKPQPIGKMRRRVQQLDDKIERQQKEIDDLRKAIGRLQDIVITVRQKANAGRL